MIADSFEHIRQKFSGTSQGDAIERLIALISEENDQYAETFLTDLASYVADIVDNEKLGRRFIDIAEQHVCRGANASLDSGLVRIVPAVDFLYYYSRKFTKMEKDIRRQRIMAELQKIRAILTTVNTDNLRQFLNDVLNLNGRLRRRGYPLWLTTEMEVNGCSVFADYVKRLALGDKKGPAFRFDIGLHHLGATPNVHPGEPDHVPNQTMTVHYPTVVDGMYYETFVRGGTTSGCAKEYVSKLDNTDAIDRLEMIE